jgi:poly(A) RNA polymerase GLD2
VYGSIPHKIDDESSDIDMSLLLGEGDATAAAAALDRVGRAVELAEAEHLAVTRVLHARIPVISIRDSLTDTSLDLSMWNVDKLHISEIFAMYFEVDARVRPLVFAVRMFSKRKQINCAFSGFVNSFAWTVAVVCFLMNRGLVPVMDVDTAPEARRDFRPADAAAPLSAGDLLIQFLEWFLAWPYQTHRLSMRTPTGITEKEAERFEDYTFVCIERPRTPYQNITRQVEKKQWTLIRGLLATALAKLKAGALIWDILA